jgi:hypothetical protein
MLDSLVSFCNTSNILRYNSFRFPWNAYTVLLPKQAGHMDKWPCILNLLGATEKSQFNLTLGTSLLHQGAEKFYECYSKI